MRRFIVLLVLLAAAKSASSQVTLSTVQAGLVTAAGAAAPFGSVSLGSTANLVFRLTNTSSSAVYLTKLIMAGQDPSEFAVVCSLSPQLCGSAPRQQLPILINPTGTLDFTIQFEPLVLGTLGVPLTINAGNALSIILFGTGVPGLTALLNNQPLGAGETISFGDVAVGSSVMMKIVLENPPTNVPVGVPAIPPLASGAFTLSGSALGEPTVAPGASVEVDLTFAPVNSGAQQSALKIGLFTYPLQGTGVAGAPPQFPAPSIRIALSSAASGEQGSLSVTLASASVASGAGTVSLAFQPSASEVKDDPTITFQDGSRSAIFTVAKGASEADFAESRAVSFGTGTTSGTLVFTVSLGSASAQATVVIPAAKIAIGVALGARNVACDPALVYCTTTNIELKVNGWDNTRTASNLVFSFFDAGGKTIASGITVNAASAFAAYFGESTLGGVFGMDALFPVDPSIADNVAIAVVALSNDLGTTQSAQITF